MNKMFLRLYSDEMNYKEFYLFKYLEFLPTDVHICSCWADYEVYEE